MIGRLEDDQLLINLDDLGGFVPLPKQVRQPQEDGGIGPVLRQQALRQGQSLLHAPGLLIPLGQLDGETGLSRGRAHQGLLLADQQLGLGAALLEQGDELQAVVHVSGLLPQRQAVVVEGGVELAELAVDRRQDRGLEAGGRRPSLLEVLEELGQLVATACDRHHLPDQFVAHPVARSRQGDGLPVQFHGLGVLAHAFEQDAGGLEHVDLAARVTGGEVHQGRVLGPGQLELHGLGEQLRIVPARLEVVGLELDQAGEVFRAALEIASEDGDAHQLAQHALPDGGVGDLLEGGVEELPGLGIQPFADVQLTEQLPGLIALVVDGARLLQMDQALVDAVDPQVELAQDHVSHVVAGVLLDDRTILQDQPIEGTVRLVKHGQFAEGEVVVGVLHQHRLVAVDHRRIELVALHLPGQRRGREHEYQKKHDVFHGSSRFRFSPRAQAAARRSHAGGGC